MNIRGDFSIITQDVRFSEANKALDLFNVVDSVQVDSFPSVIALKVVSRFTIEGTPDSPQLEITYWVINPDGTREQVRDRDESVGYHLNVNVERDAQRSGNILGLNLSVNVPGTYKIISQHGSEELTSISLDVTSS